MSSPILGDSPSLRECSWRTKSEASPSKKQDTGSLRNTSKGTNSVVPSYDDSKGHHSPAKLKHFLTEGADHTTSTQGPSRNQQSPKDKHCSETEQDSKFFLNRENSEAPTEMMSNTSFEYFISNIQPKPPQDFQHGTGSARQGRGRGRARESAQANGELRRSARIQKKHPRRSKRNKPSSRV
ncbi:hypothetical protein B0T10DRAFT_466368 [Thelonectria olida]|uniref:Uncharacterized protein n=1 Tax=Thelonectria olida TaxID=1576542 RepID=A0A9P9AJ44_9HYPO|nr:hypothetical protein B0T10DRAFT_466368 [Thelonectria olida]